MTDPTITIAGLRAQVDSLETSLRATIDDGATSEEVRLIAAAENACLTAERDALAAQLAEVRAELAKAPKVCAIHSYEHGPGPCMTCGAWPPGTRELIAACRTRIAGLEQAADERIKEDKYRGARMDAIRAALGAHPFASYDHIADRIRALTDRVAELEARPVLTDEALSAALNVAGLPGGHAPWIMANLGPVTLPAQDVAARLTKAHSLEAAAVTGNRIDNTAAMERALASLGAPPTSPTAARPVFAGVSVEEIADVYETAYRAYEHANGSPMYIHCRAAGIRAVLARLGVSLVAPVDPEAVARRYHDNGTGPSSVVLPYWGDLNDRQRIAAIAAMRATLTAAGIPVTPEVGK